MAGGWTRDGAVQDQIDDTVKDAVLQHLPARTATENPTTAKQDEEEPDGDWSPLG